MVGLNSLLSYLRVMYDSQVDLAREKKAYRRELMEYVSLSGKAIYSQSGYRIQRNQIDGLYDVYLFRKQVWVVQEMTVYRMICWYPFQTRYPWRMKRTITVWEDTPQEEIQRILTALGDLIVFADTPEENSLERAVAEMEHIAFLNRYTLPLNELELCYQKVESWLWEGTFEPYYDLSPRGRT